MIEFLSACISQRTLDPTSPSLFTPELDSKLFNLVFRFVSEGRDITTWIDWRFVIGVTCVWYDSRQVELAALHTRLWRRARTKMYQEFSLLRDAYIDSFESIVLDLNDIVPTLVGLRYMVTLNTDIVDILVDGDGLFLTSIHDHYEAYRAHLSESDRWAMLYIFYTLVVCLAYRASESSVGQNKKGKGTAGMEENMFFRLFDKLFGNYFRGGRFDGFIEEINRETPLAEIMTEWIGAWKGADEAVEGVSSYLQRLKMDVPEDAEVTFTDDVLSQLKLTLGFGASSYITYFPSCGYSATSW
jgi:hypothetical protein